MTQGVFLIAFGNSSYGWAAYNLAFSIKYFDPDLPICIMHDNKAFAKGGFDMSVFDLQIPLTQEDVSNPAKIKASLYEKLPYDCNLYLDVDALCFKSLKPLFERLIKSDVPYAVTVFETYDKDSPNAMPMMYWAFRSDIWEHYKLDEHKLPATQSSIQYIKKCEQSEKLFLQLQKNLENPIPLNKLANKWGGQQPDELYLNIALAQLNMNPHIGDDALFFGNRIDKRSLTEISQTYYILSLFGGKNMTRPMYKDYYDRLMHNYCRAKGKEHRFKTHYVLQQKHADNRSGMSIERKVTKPEVNVTYKKTPVKTISLAITHFERYDMVMDSFKDVVSDERISEVVIVDDCSQGGSYEKLVETFKSNSKIKLFRNEKNLGMSLNKSRAISLCENKWAIIFDSDNKLSLRYIDRLYSMVIEWNEKIIYCPDGALPEFNYKAFAGVAINQSNVKQYLNKPMFDCFLNTCNYFVNRDEYLKVYTHDESVKESDTIHFNYGWLKAGNKFYVVPNMNYLHRVHNGSGFMKNVDYNLKKAEETKKLIAQLA